MLTRTRKPEGRVTLRDIAERSGFSISTVSLVLNQAPLAQNLAQATQAKVREVAAALGYRPNSFARTLKTRRSGTLGVIAFDITDPFCGEILRGIEKELAATPYLAIMMDVRGDQQQFEHCIEVLVDRHVEALIVVANWLCLDLGVFTQMETHQAPVLVVGRESWTGRFPRSRPTTFTARNWRSTIFTSWGTAASRF